MKSGAAKDQSGSDKTQVGAMRDERRLEVLHAHKNHAASQSSGKTNLQTDRRSPDRVNASIAPVSEHCEPSYHPHYLPQQPRIMAGLLLLGYILAGGVAKAVPAGLAPLLAAIASIVIFAVGAKLAAFERRENAPSVLRPLVLIIGVLVPMACAGFVLGSWVAAGLAWQWAVATIVCINAASAALFGMRIVSLFTGKLAIWATFVMLDPTPSTIAALVGTAIALTLIARMELIGVRKRRTAREARERLASRAEDILRSFEETGQGWFWETDRRGLISYISPSAAKVLGKSVEELLGHPLSDIVDLTSGASGAERTLAFHLSARSAFQEVELRAAGTNPARWWALNGRPVYDTFNNFCGFRGHGADLTEQRRSEQQVSRLAHYDSLTGLANRMQMSQTLERILASPHDRDRACAVFMLDLDRFKQVNDTMGHPAGDALLKQVAQRLERTVDGVGRCGRLGGDEFNVIVPGSMKRDQLARLAREIIASLSQPYSIEGQNVIIGASVGIALSPEHGVSNDELIRNVDLALYSAKDAGRGTFRFFADDLHSAAEERAETEADLREAIAAGHLQLYYQPVVYAGNETVTGFEALLRWKHPTKGWQEPAKFIPVAEDTGLIDGIGHWALRTACEDLARWPEGIRCAVNVSPVQFSNPELPTIVANALAHSGIDPSRLELEITESVFLNDGAGTEAMFAALKRVGVRLALDDFGTGYSSLGYLKKAPFDKIKIDQSFVRCATEPDSRNGAIIASITSLAEALRMDTTAEGVETLDELELVRELGCSHVQGNIYHKPLSSDDAAELVAGSLILSADGPRSARRPRKVLLRRIAITHEGTRAPATLRSISEGGAMLDGVWGLKEGNEIQVHFNSEQSIRAEVRWRKESRIGVQFAAPIARERDGSFQILREGRDPAQHAGSF
ncbi:MAG: EAL domain-containing protein [Pseudomonadota bacterium]